MTQPIHYVVELANPDAHLFEVRCTVADPDTQGQVFRLPTWIPGSYMIREFARNVVRLRAEDGGGNRIAISKQAKDSWLCAPCAGPMTVIAEVYAWDLSVRGAHFDRTHAYFNGTHLFLAPEGKEGRECIVDLMPPVSSVENEFGNWRVITSMPRAGAAPYGFGRYRAANYDELIDHPVEIGTFTLESFDAGGARHDVAITGRHDCDTQRLVDDLRKICQSQIDLFGGAPGSRAPVDYYAFLTMALGDAYGGLEHRASTSLVIGRDKLPTVDSRDQRYPSDDYLVFLGLASHEYFHTWNVKRIKPAAFVPYDLTREAYTRQLWIFEGFTSYYDNLTLLRAGVISTEQYLTLIGQDISKVLRGSGRSKQSVADSSFDAWIKYYRQDENTPNAIVSYYVKGSLVALLLDLTLRRDSDITLDDVMRELWKRYGQTATGLPEGAFQSLVESMSGLDLTGFFARYVDGTDELPLADALAAFGIGYNLRTAEGNKDMGGKPGKSRAPKKSSDAAKGESSLAIATDAAKDESGLAVATDAPVSAEPSRLWLGARWTTGGEARLTHVFDDGPALAAGLAAGDTIVAWNGLRVGASTLQSHIDRMAQGAQATIHAFRRDELMVFAVQPKAAPMDTCWLAVDADAAADVAARRDAWLKGPDPTP